MSDTTTDDSEFCAVDFDVEKKNGVDGTFDEDNQVEVIDCMKGTEDKPSKTNKIFGLLFLIAGVCIVLFCLLSIVLLGFSFFRNEGMLPVWIVFTLFGAGFMFIGIQLRK